LMEKLLENVLKLLLLQLPSNLQTKQLNCFSPSRFLYISPSSVFTKVEFQITFFGMSR
jgi:hypothetical protein